ncbi:MAG: DUF2180 family protein [Armatimonadia bacterium]|nr:DUF2180 family protein [Armatimonadia bacterium]
MNCYDCTVASTTSAAVAVCMECGRGVCMDHASVIKVPAFYEVSAGMAPVRRRCRLDRRRVHCGECQAAVDCCDSTGG